MSASYERPPACGAEPDFLAGGGEMGALMRRHDWSGSALGPPHAWPQSLKTAVRIMLTSRYGMFVWWGRELINIYNDAYIPMLGARHPMALGRSARHVWTEIWDKIGPRTDAVLLHGQATFDEDLLLLMERYGYREEAYFTFAYSPIPGDDGGIGGLFCAVTEETKKVIGERRLTLLNDLSAGVADARTIPAVCEKVSAALAGNRRDFPFVLLYLFEPGEKRLRLAIGSGIDPHHPACAPVLDLDHDDAVWRCGEALARGEPVTIDDLADRYASVPCGDWDRPPPRAVTVPIARQGQSTPAGFMIAALNPYLPFNDRFREFVSLVARQIATGIANARAYEEERKRAEALAELDRAKTVFFSNVSHEFRTPLTLILGPAEDALAEPDEPLAPRQRERLMTIQRNGLRLKKLVNTLLDFSRVEAGRVQAAYEPMDLAALTRDLASSFRSACERAGLTLTIDAPALPQPVYVDRDMWEKVVLNLLSNAFKFTFEGGITVTLRAEGEQAVLAVSDTGTGIPPHELQRVFERFHRVEGASGRTHEGTGIGLALVRELVKLHKGSVTADSTMGRGTTFTVRVPFGSAHLPQEHVGGSRSQAMTPLRADAFVNEALRWLPDGALTHDIEDGTGPVIAAGDAEAPRARIVVADDNADMREYVGRLLSPHYDVVAVPDGDAALQELARSRPDLVLADVMMPRIDGFQLLQRLRANPALRDIPVIILSARAGEEARVEGLQAGADSYLVKPFSARELLARVDANVRLARMRAEVLQRERELNETLERRVADEIAKRMKAEEVLRQAQKMEAVGQLTGGIAHDFNNLLQVMIGNLDTLRRRIDLDTRPDLKRPVEMAIRGADRAAELTSQLLAFSRRQPLRPKPVELSKLVTGMSNLLRRTLGETIAIETVLAGALWIAYADANQLESAILNLAVNARDAMPEGGKLTIETANVRLDEAYAETHPEVQAGQYVMVAVSDTGTGMTKEVAAKAFDPFFTTKELGKGTGLGLSQVYGFIKQSGGHVKIYSEPGEGTTVKIYLPRHFGEASAAAEAALPLVAGTGTEVILVVEDDEDVRTNTVEMLRDLGYGVLAAADGAGALKLLEAGQHVDLLFTDVGLPGGLNGRQLMDEARRRRPGLRVLFTSGYARNAIVHHGRLDPGVEMLAKPFTYAALAAKIRDMLDRAPALDSAPAP